MMIISFKTVFTLEVGSGGLQGLLRIAPSFESGFKGLCISSKSHTDYHRRSQFEQSSYAFFLVIELEKNVSENDPFFIKKSTLHHSPYS